MAAEFIRTSNLAKVEPEAHCWACGAEPSESPDDDLWTIWHEDIIYCPECAEKKGVGPGG